MNAETLTQAWRALRAEAILAEDQIASTPVRPGGSDTGLSLAVDARGALHLLAPVEGAPSFDLPPDYNGLQLRQGRLAGEECLDLQSPAAHEVMFSALCAQVIEAICEQGRDPWRATVNIVRNWQSAWRPFRQPMSKPVQIGLAGELIMLQALWLPALGPRAVFLWSGADKERHDFVGEQLHMEVKATTRSRHEHQISRADQLDAPDGRRLTLASVQLEESVAGAQSIATLIDTIVSFIDRDPAAIDAFMTKLGHLEWSEDMRRSPDLIRFHLRDAQLFEVDDEFPRLPPTFELPAGVLAIRYTISLANLPTLDFEKLKDDIAAL